MNDTPFGFGANDNTPEDPDSNNKGSDKNADKNSGNDSSKKSNDGSPNPEGFDLSAILNELGGLGGLANSGGGAGGAGGLGDMGGLGAALQQLGALIQNGGAGAEGPVNWQLAQDTARKAVLAQGEDPTVSEAQTRAATDAVALANVWLDPVMQFPGTGGDARTWSRSEWIDGTLPAWKKIVTPVAEHLQSSMVSLMPGKDELAGMTEGLPPELLAMAGPFMNMARQMGSSMFGMQLGQGLAALAGDVLSASEIGIPLTTDSRPTLLPHNIQKFGEGLEVSQSDLMVYLALREVAHQRLFAHVPWLRGRVEGAIEAYARGIHVDQKRIEDAIGDINLENPEGLQQVLSSGVFEPVDSEEQKAAKDRLESLLAMIEGWVDDVVTDAAGDKLPAFEQLREALRRRRGSGGPAEKTFATLVGLEMRPRRLREATDVWRQLRESPGGIEARDALWAHPDLLPSAEDLESATGFVGTTDQFGAMDIDKELSDLEAKGGIESLINDANAPKEDASGKVTPAKASEDDAPKSDGDPSTEFESDEPDSEEPGGDSAS